mmetsp:Transcript_24915/g.40033  ORF Transcript_24915/g.40033 Transcript_24915/m.40033 type:complete len:125 (-) Transcript_24915:169-543(-)
MLYGREDPWVVPMWGQRAYLNLRLEAAKLGKPVDEVVRYLEISPAGHCPHDEAPETVSQITDDWLVALENNDGGHPLEGKISIPCDIEEADGRKIHVDFQGERPPRNAGEWIGTISLRSKLSNR